MHSPPVPARPAPQAAHALCEAPGSWPAGHRAQSAAASAVRAVSGGQRSRVALAAVSYVEPHVLVLDEPTNNLDLESVAALADCVERFEGGVILVSHDQYFVGRVAKEVWLVGGPSQAVRKIESFDKYRDYQLKKLAPMAPVDLG